MILKYFQQNLNKVKQWKCIVAFAINKENLKALKYHIQKNTSNISIVFSKCDHEYKKKSKEEGSIEILKFLV